MIYVHVYTYQGDIIANTENKNADKVKVPINVPSILAVCMNIIPTLIYA